MALTSIVQLKKVKTLEDETDSEKIMSVFISPRPTFKIFYHSLILGSAVPPMFSISNIASGIQLQ